MRLQRETNHQLPCAGELTPKKIPPESWLGPKEGLCGGMTKIQGPRDGLRASRGEQWPSRVLPLLVKPP